MARTGRIPRVQLASDWAVHGRHRTTSLKSGPNQRSLRIAIDRASVGQDEIADVLLDFVDHEAVEILSTEARDGGAVLRVDPYEPGEIVGVTATFGPHRRVETAVQPHRFWEQVARDARGSERDNIAALLIGHAACQLHVDALVTAHHLLLDPESIARRFVGQSNPMAPSEAVALLGLYLRSRDDFTFTPIISTDRETYFDVLLPGIWRWFGACVASSVAGSSSTPARLGRSTRERVTRALKARDRLHEHYLTPASESAIQEAHAQLDTILQQLSGAFDAVARVANRVYGIDASRNRVKWAWKWRTSDLAAADRDLADFMERGHWARDTYDILSILRNTIHGEGLEPVVHHSHGRGTTFGVTTSRDEMDELIRIARRRGGLARWGLRPPPIPLPDMPHFIVADRFVEALVPDALRALNALMRLTKVELLPGVDGTALRKRPPNSRRDLFVNSWTRRRFRQLAGL